MGISFICTELSTGLRRKKKIYKTKDESPRLLRSPTSYPLSWRNASAGLEMPGEGAQVGRSSVNIRYKDQDWVEERPVCGSTLCNRVYSAAPSQGARVARSLLTGCLPWSTGVRTLTIRAPYSSRTPCSNKPGLAKQGSRECPGN